MHILEYNLRATHEIEEMERNRDMMEAYLRITAEHGPSHALIDFVNFDGKLSEELGIGIESFSVGTQHEILASKLYPDALDEAAYESLAEKIDTFAKWIAGVGSVAHLGAIAAILIGGKMVAGKIDITPVSLPGDHLVVMQVDRRPLPHFDKMAAVWIGGALAALAGAAAISINRAINGVYTYHTFDTWMKFTESSVKLDELATAKIPTTFDTAAWRKFYEFMEVDPTSPYKRASKAADDEYRKNITSDLYKKVIGDDSGWTTDNYAKAIKWYKAELEKFAKKEKAVTPTLSKIAAWLKTNEKNTDPEVREVRKYINKTLGKSIHSMHNTHEVLGEVDSVLKNVSKMFKAKDVK